jgi:hypothetical protein
VRLADTVAAELAQRAWAGIDTPIVAHVDGIEAALQRVFPDLTYGEVAEWAQPAVASVSVAAISNDGFSFQSRLVGALASALILGAKLQETQGT